MEALTEWVGPRPHPLDWNELYLRLSVTDACNLRCRYCRPVIEEHVNEAGFLSFEGIERLVGWCHSRGSRKVRLTGGEPLLRKNFPELVGRLRGRFPDLDLSLSTNGLRLSPIVRELREAGLDRINISLDTLDRGKFRDLTGVDGLATVLEAIDRSREVGFDPIKLNVVLLRGTNEDELGDLARFAFERGLYIRFIEYMPHCKTETNRFGAFSTGEAREIRSREFRLEPLEDRHRPVGAGPARYWRVKGFDLPVGLISSVTEDICKNCHRLRITARGDLVRCIQLNLFENIREMVEENREEEFAALMERSYSQRPPERAEGHVFFLGMQLVQTGG